MRCPLRVILTLLLSLVALPTAAYADGSWPFGKERDPHSFSRGRDLYNLGLLGVKHRGVLHSGLAVVLVAFLAELMGGWLGYRDVGLALALGYASHVIIADAATIAGVPLLWPTPRRFHLLPRLLRVRTGGLVEKLIFVATTLSLIWLLPDLLPPEFLKTLRQWLA